MLYLGLGFGFTTTLSRKKCFLKMNKWMMMMMMIKDNVKLIFFSDLSSVQNYQCCVVVFLI